MELTCNPGVYPSLSKLLPEVWVDDNQDNSRRVPAFETHGHFSDPLSQLTALLFVRRTPEAITRGSPQASVRRKGTGSGVRGHWKNCCWYLEM